MMRVLTNLRIDEVSACIKGANPHARVAIAKSNNKFMQIFAKVSERDRGPSRHERRAAIASRANNANIPEAPDSHHLVALADTVAAANNLDRQSALHWLLHKPAGRALAQTHKQYKEAKPMSRSQELAG